MFEIADEVFITHGMDVQIQFLSVTLKEPHHIPVAEKTTPQICKITHCVVQMKILMKAAQTHIDRMAYRKYEFRPREQDHDERYMLNIQRQLVDHQPQVLVLQQKLLVVLKICISEIPHFIRRHRTEIFRILIPQTCHPTACIRDRIKLT